MSRCARTSGPLGPQVHRYEARDRDGGFIAAIDARISGHPLDHAEHARRIEAFFAEHQRRGHILGLIWGELVMPKT